MTEKTTTPKVSTVADDEETPNSTTISSANHAFLHFLRSSDANFQTQNDDTLRARNGDIHKRNLSSLPNLFDPPEKETITTPTQPKQQEKVNLAISNSDPPTKNLRIPRPPPVHRRDRSVSFDQRTNFNELKQPALEDPPRGNTKPRNTPGIPLANFHHRIPSGNFTLRGMQRTPSNRKLSVEDLVGSGPYELEAETNILKALEEQQEQDRHSHHRLRSETSTIMSGVPDNLVHDFSLEDSIGNLGEKEGDNSLPSHHSNIDEDDNHSRKSATRQRRPLLNREGRHRRTMSVEDRLAGLTFAMHTLEAEQGMPASNYETANLDSAGSSAEQQLGRNAAMITQNFPNANALPPLRSRLATYESVNLPVVQEADEKKSESPNSSTRGDMEDQLNQPPSLGHSPSNRSYEKKKRKNSPSVLMGATDKLKDDWEIWQSFFRPRKEHILYFLKTVVFYLTIPLVGIAAILFYCFGNLSTGLSEDGSPGSRASTSWWLLFCVRQSLTLTLALGVQVIVIDFLCVGTRVMLRILGPLLTLLIVQSKGWPSVVFWWSIFDFALLYGGGPFAKHWGHWQEAVALFNDSNPSGHVVDSQWNTTILAISFTVSVAAAFKRFVVGLLLGRQTFGHYGEQLAKVMNKMLLISEVAQLAKRIEKAHTSSNLVDPLASVKQLHFDRESLRGLGLFPSEDEDSATSTLRSAHTEKIIDTDKRDPLTGKLLESERAKLMQILDRWEEPDRTPAGYVRSYTLLRPNKYAKSLTRPPAGHVQNKQVSISAVLRFRNALTFIKNEYPFSYAFGPAYSREACIESSQQVYNRLLKNNLDEKLVYLETLALIALDENGMIDQQKATGLVKVFRPDRDGALSVLDFVKSTDSVYKEFRLLQASIQNSSQINRGFENIFNIIFYAVIVTIILSQLGLDPLALFLSLSSVILAFAFMIGSASSKYFEGLLFILVRRPYGIGDMIHISNVEHDTSIEGAPCWVVQHVTLYETIAIWLPTCERASLSNGSLASSRVINWTRSPNARFHILLTFPIETKYETIEIFKRAIEEYMKVRPREWLALNGFRVHNIVTDKGVMQVMLVIQHRDAWANIGQVLDSKGNLLSYCHEVQKKLGMHYRTPPVPIDLMHANLADGFIDALSQEGPNSSYGEQEDEDTQFQQFRSMAKNKHNIRLN